MTPPVQESYVRLAARTLVEWRTPKTSPEYRAVLQALAAERGLTALLDQRNSLVDLDDHGILLWYLSERLHRSDGVVPEVRLTRSDVAITVRNVLTEALAKAGPYGQVARSAAKWLGETQSRAEAIRVLAAMMSSEPAKNLGPLGSFGGTVTKWPLGHLAGRTRLISMSIHIISAAAALGSLVALFWVTWGAPLVDDSTRAVVQGLTLSGICMGLLRKKHASDAVAAEIRREINHVVKKTHISPDILAREFASNIAIWDSVMRTESSKWWMSLVFGWTNVASREVQQKVLTLLRDPDVAQDVRDLMLSWLFRLNSREVDVLPDEWRKLRSVV